MKKIDIVICTALIPGKKAPLIIKDNMFNNMQPGSVIYDLAAIQGGNTAFTEVDKVVEKNGVKIMGESNILNRLPTSASNLYAKNVFNFVSNLYDKENKKININLDDEIIDIVYEFSGSANAMAFNQPFGLPDGVEGQYTPRHQVSEITIGNGLTGATT